MEELNQPPPQDSLTNTVTTDPESNSKNNNNGENKVQNPWRLLMSLNRQQKITFIAAFLGWTLDAFDYFIVVLVIPDIAREFHMKPSDIAGR
jgi:SHS family lactate transporter-like MFS transporter